MQPSVCSSSVPLRPSRRQLTHSFRLAILVLICVAAAAFGVGFLRFAAVSPDEVTSVKVTIDDRERGIKVEIFRPTDDTQVEYPAILFLHGVEGPDRYRALHTQSCRWLADQGYLVFYVHYFDAVDYEDLWLLRSDGSLDKAAIDSCCWQDAERWSGAVLQVVGELARRPDVDQHRIALDGISLGGFIALEVADEAHRDTSVPDIRAVVANWAAQFELTECQRGFPPTLHIHGEVDEIVPLSHAQQSVNEILAVASQAELLVIPAAPHVARSRHSDNRTLSFLASHMKTESQRNPTETAGSNSETVHR